MTDAAVQPKSREINFVAKDSDECIIFMDGPQPQAIKAASLSKLIERLCANTDYLGA
jgi:hypothetical protein